MSDPFNIDNDDLIIQSDNDQQKSAFPEPMQDVTIDSSSHGINNSIDSSERRGHQKTFTGGPFSLNYYRKYFDLNTKDFFANCWKSLNPFTKLDQYEFQQVGDLYGPVWITATLIFLLFFCNSVAQIITSWLLNKSEDDTETLHINYFKILLSSINLLYGYIFIVPLLLWAVLRFYFKVVNVIPVTKLISMYSYSNILWIPAALLSVFRGLLANHNSLDAALKWLCIVMGSILSGAGILVRLHQYFSVIFGSESEQDSKKHLGVLMGALILAHVGFSLGVKMCFFGKL
ncbi:hypothetical protein FOA43_004590 [Brettanomyces nanus]|uniref:Protein YIP n=1 Tax=Eeniella nana TaxID=13502 RepID=A0A875S8H0_EENNA|nr:uncharacterized protein FOA43_004590 [Brettanomyces nanus]QPG77183.1 hypothetical protein FOA43_004590 [Brettanomyces nanus]